MFIKLIGLAFSIVVSAAYVIGFVYDGAYLEEFGVNYYELLATPLDYLAIGGMYLLKQYAVNLTVILLVSTVFGTFYVPVRNRIPASLVNKYVDAESVPYVMVGAIPLLIILLMPVISDAKYDARNVDKDKKDVLCMEGQEECVSGVVLRYRDSKIIFYNSKTRMVSIYPEDKLVSATSS